MNKHKIINFIQQLKHDMTPMSPRQRFDHIWYHFKWHLIAIVACITAATSLTVSVINGTKPFILGGGIVNVSISADGTTYLTDQYLAAMGTDKKHHQISLFDSGISETNAAELELNSSFTTTFMTLLGAKKFDYLIMDKPTATYYMEQGLFMDLHSIFNIDELQSMESLLLYANIYNEDGITTGEMYPVGICIDALHFTSECITPSEGIYILFAENAPHKDQLHMLYDYLCAWTSGS